MNDSDEAHTAALAIVKAQRDALAVVVAKLWDRASIGRRLVSSEALRWMIDAGLVDRGLATREQAERHSVEMGELTTQLSPFGRASMEGLWR
jgi:hypothetical protein